MINTVFNMKTFRCALQNRRYVLYVLGRGSGCEAIVRGTRFTLNNGVKHFRIIVYSR